MQVTNKGQSVLILNAKSGVVSIAPGATADQDFIETRVFCGLRDAGRIAVTKPKGKSNGAKSAA